MKLTRLIFPILASAALCACGFTPANAPRTADGSLAFKSIRVDNVKSGSIIDDESGFYMAQSLRKRLGTTGSTHILEVTSKVGRAGLGVSGRDIASRYDLTMSTRYVLRDAKSGDVLDKGTVRSTSTFGSSVDPYARDATENNSMRLVAAENADRLLYKLAGYYAKK